MSIINNNGLFHELAVSNTQRTITKNRGQYDLTIYLDNQDRRVGIRSSLNFWKVFQYDDDGNKIFEQDSDGNWEKRKYDSGTILQYTNSSGTHWVKNN